VEFESAYLFLFLLLLLFFQFLLFFLMSVHFAVREVAVKHEPLAKSESLRAVYVILGKSK